MAVGIYSYTFKSALFENVMHSRKCQNKTFLQKCQNGPNIHFLEYLKMTRTFESVKIESVGSGVDAYCLCTS